MADQDRIYYLLQQATTQRMTEAECAEMEALLSPGQPDAEQVRGMLDDYFARETSPVTVDANDPEWKTLLRAIVAVDKAEASPAPVHRVHFLKTAWFRYAAAILVLIAGVALFYYFSHTSQSGPEMAETVPSPTPGDILPGYDRAVLTLSNGQRVALDSAGAATIKDGDLSIEKNDGQLLYTADGTAVLNTMTTPKGGQYALRLADGTRVRLNAASSITYPTAFVGQKRVVRVTGEAYFDVTKDPAKPFIVETGSDVITVLGTRFNVNAYPDEAAVKTSLAQGSVRMQDGAVLRPGQAYVQGDVVTTDLSQDLAWTTGIFNFHNADLPTVLRQLARWYDIEVRYENGVPTKRLQGEIGRNLNLSEVLRVLDNLGIRTRLDGRTLTILNDK